MLAKKFIYLIVLSLVHIQSTSSQTKLSGCVIDSITQQPIPFANVYDVSNKKGVSTDTTGNFELVLKKKNHLNLEITHLEYKKRNYYIHILQDTLIHIVLQPNTIHLNDVVVKGTNRTQYTSSVLLQQKQINTIPALIGEKDILKALQYTPGVQAGNEGTIGFSVRGGGEDQNLYLIDNMPIYTPAHLLGFFSTFNPDIIQQTELIRAGMPANYGGKLSSVVNIKTIKPSFTEFKGSYSLGLISAKAYAEIPVLKNKSGLMISARRSYLDLLTSIQAQLSDADDMQKIGFYDINIKYEQHINKNNTFSIQHLRSNDFFFYLFGLQSSGFKDKSGIEWCGNASFVNFKHIAHNNGTLSVLAGINNYAYDYLNQNYSLSGKLENSYKKKSSIGDYLLKVDWNREMNDKFNYSVGFSNTFHRAVPRDIFIMKKELSSKSEDANEAALFAQMGLKLSESDVLSLGFRQNIYWSDSTAYFPLEPRLTYMKRLNDSWSLKSSLSRNIQFIHRVEDFSTGLPSELWYVSGKKLKYEEAYQISSELNHTITPLKLDIGAAIYYKWMNNLVDYGTYYADLPLPSIFANHLIETGGVGQAYGLELFCNKPFGKLNYAVSYLLSKSIRKFKTINNDNWYPSNTDRLHNFNTTISYKLNEKVLFSLAWIFSTGKPITIPEGRYYSNNPWATIQYYVGNRNNSRLADYHRLDLSVQFKKIKRKGNRIIEIGLFNAYNRKNPYSIDFEDEMFYKDGAIHTTGKVKIKQYSLFPIVPSISYIRNF